MNKYSKIQKGFATLPTVMALMILIFLVSGGIAVWSLSEVFSTQSQTNSRLALVYAEEGARDALTRIARKYNYTCVNPDPCYSIPMVANGCSTTYDGCAQVTVIDESTPDKCAADHPKKITSKGRVKSNIRQIQVCVKISSEGEITDAVWEELTD